MILAFKKRAVAKIRLLESKIEEDQPLTKSGLDSLLKKHDEKNHTTVLIKSQPTLTGKAKKDLRASSATQTSAHNLRISTRYL